VVLVNYPLSVQLRVSDYCHSKGIYYIGTESRGAFTSAFVDLGKAFEVLDGNGEEPLTGAVADLSTDGVVTMLPKIRHGLSNGNAVKLLNVEGLTGVSDAAYKVKVLNPHSFALVFPEDGPKSFSGSFKPGTATWQEVKVPFVMQYKSMREAMASNPEFAMTDFLKLDGSQLWLGLRSVHEFAEQSASKTYPRPWNTEDAAKVLEIAKAIAAKEGLALEAHDEALIKKITYTFQGSLVGLTAFMGGLLGQEVLKSLSGKFTPLQQWLAVDAREVVPDVSSGEVDASNFLPQSHRSDGQAIVVGRDVCNQLGALRVFMIGSGAIGCEMLKNFAMMGVGVKSAEASGTVVVTDNDLIEKSNLNRQFLFRTHNIGQPKSVAAAQAIVAMNPDIVVESQQHKVGADSENVYTNSFWRSLDMVVNALDNIPARLYVDSKCVENQRPLVESGTMGTKGHVQVIVPHLTANYGSTRDPPEAGIPLCTLKSFPSQIEHTIQWARDKWTTLFGLKPEEAKGILEEANGRTSNSDGAASSSSHVDNLIAKIRTKKPGKKDFQHVHQLFNGIPLTFADCIYQARRKFETYYVNSITQLLHAFPLEHKNDDGTLFWALPRRPPRAIQFDAQVDDHLDFVIHAAFLYAKAYRIKDVHPSSDRAWYAKAATAVILPPYVLKADHHIETNESVTKENAASAASSSAPATKKDDWAPGEFDVKLESFKTIITAKLAVVPFPDEFEKDDDSNHHIDFITAASNLRASQYGIQTVDRMKTKFVAGKIIPAMATSTAAITGLASIELIKLLKKEKLEAYKNSWMNLALPSLLLSEPQACESIKIHDDLSISIWDRWEVNEGDLVLGQFINHLKREYKLVATAIIQNTTLIYAAILGGKKALPQRMSTLLSRPEGAAFVDLTVQFETLDGKDVKGPPVRFYFEQNDSSDDSDSDSDSSSDESDKEEK
jgi:ubiquitin-activating enzyme E1